MYRYIGNKSKLLPNIMDATHKMIGSSGTVVDMMAGTGLVSLEYRKNGYQVIGADMMTYTKHHLNVHLLLDKPPEFLKLNEFKDTSDRYSSTLEYLNELDEVQGYFYTEFSPEGMPANESSPRKYFTSYNASKIDAIRLKINEWILDKKITPLEESLLKHSLILAVNHVANISGTYGYFLSEFRPKSKEIITLKKADITSENPSNHQVLQGLAEELSQNITADLCYIDPPYMKRQYAANYHILETIARGDFPEAIGKSGLRDWWDQHSSLCTKTKGLESFSTIITNMNCKNFIISYSEDGLFTIDQLITHLSQFGKVQIESIKHTRFKSNRSTLPIKIKEYIIFLRR